MLNENHKTDVLRTAFPLIISFLFIFLQLFTLFFNNQAKLYEKSWFDALYTALTLAGGIILFLITLVELASLKFDKTANKYTFYAAVFLLLMSVLDYDFFNLCNKMGWAIPEVVLPYLSAIQVLCFYGVEITLLMFFLTTFHIGINRIEVILSIAISVLLFGLYIVLSFYQMSFIAIALFFLLIVYWTIKIYYVCHKENRQTLTFYISSIIIFVCYGVMMANSIIASISSIQAAGVGAISYLFIGLLFILIYFIFALRVTRESYEKEKYEEEVKKLQSSILLKQMTPHFLFNSLNKIKMDYATSLDNGDYAIDLLAKQLRYLTDAGVKNLVPIKTELDIVLNYIELINVDSSNPFEVVFNVEYDAFEVPCLSVQTMVENAVKYSEVNLKKDGFIEIHTYKDEKKYYVEIKDNGKGFKVNEVLDNSYGLSNTKERLKLLLGGSLEVDSKIGKGTVVKMIIPINKGDDRDDKNIDD